MFSRLILVALICGAAWAFPQGLVSVSGGASASVSTDASATIPTVTTPATPTVPAIVTTLPTVTTPATPTLPAIDTTLPAVTLPTTPAVPAIAITLPTVTTPATPTVPAIDTTLPAVTLPTTPAVPVDVSTVTGTPTLPSASTPQTIAQYMESYGGPVTALINAIKAIFPEIYNKLSDPANPVTFLMPPTTQLAPMFDPAQVAALPGRLQQIIDQNILKGSVTPAALTPSTILQNINGVSIGVTIGLDGQASVGVVAIGPGPIRIGVQVVLQALP